MGSRHTGSVVVVQNSHCPTTCGSSQAVEPVSCITRWTLNHQTIRTNLNLIFLQWTLHLTLVHTCWIGKITNYILSQHNSLNQLSLILTVLCLSFPVDFKLQVNIDCILFTCLHQFFSKAWALQSVSTQYIFICHLLNVSWSACITFWFNKVNLVTITLKVSDYTIKALQHIKILIFSYFLV